MRKILVVDDEENVFRRVTRVTQNMQCEVEWETTLSKGLSAIEENTYDVVLLSDNLPDGRGVEVVSRICQAPSHPEVVVLTRLGDLNDAEAAICDGAWNYIQKTYARKDEDIRLNLKYLLEYHKEKMMHRPCPVPVKCSGIVGESQALQVCFDHLARATSGDANVLITGETGTGKELFARAIHQNSNRWDDSLVVVDCAALPVTLVESLLFGHERGSYTGAYQARDGLVGQADGGTLFLDEIGEMPLAIQKIFLRVLQERKYRSVGGTKEIPSDFRLVAATNRNLEEMVREGTFRKDLLYRIRAINITLPPLRAREDDIKLLATHYRSIICQRYGIENKDFAPDFIEALKGYSWPGNVRELINALETAISQAGPEATLYARHLPKDIRLQLIGKALEKTINGESATEAGPSLSEAIQLPLETFKSFRKSVICRLEKQYLQALINAAHNNKSKAINISGLSRSRLYDLLKQHQLSL